MLFMVIERFRDNDMVPIYQRVRDSGLLQAWILQWRGAGVTFEIVPVVPSAQTREVVAPHLIDA